MDIQEVKVLLSADQYGRVAIVRRKDGLLCLYQHWHWTPEVQRSAGLGDGEDRRWTTAYDALLYNDIEPVSGVYGSVEDAEKEARRLLGLETE
ncbi:hypothetical protein SxD43FB_19325 [Sphingobium sp. D43FB]|nr:hypothetical protein SxD43FB_19325 [Sphingobium sp. D43FB]